MELIDSEEKREYTFEEFITELSQKHAEAEVLYEKLKKEKHIVCSI